MDNSLSPIESSIAAQIKSRTNRRKGSKYLYDRVIQNLIKKYFDSDDENVDNNNKVVKVNNNGKRKNANMGSRSVVDEDNDDNDSIGTTIEDVVSRGRRRTTTARRETKAKKMTTTISVASTSKSSIDHNYCRPKQLQLKNDRASLDSASSVDQFELALIKHENRNNWSDRTYQLMCLNNMITVLAKRDATAVSSQLKLRQLAIKALGLPTLPSRENIYTIIQFNCKGEAKFEFYFLSDESPLHITERIKGYDQELFAANKNAFKMIIEDIRYDPTLDDNDRENNVSPVVDFRNAAQN